MMTAVIDSYKICAFCENKNTYYEICDTFVNDCILYNNFSFEDVLNLPD